MLSEIERKSVSFLRRAYFKLPPPHFPDHLPPTEGRTGRKAIKLK